MFVRDRKIDSDANNRFSLSLVQIFHRILIHILFRWLIIDCGGDAIVNGSFQKPIKKVDILNC